MNCITKKILISSLLMIAICIGQSYPEPIPLNSLEFEEMISRDESDCEDNCFVYDCDWIEENTSSEYDCCAEDGDCVAQNGPLGAWCCDDAFELNPILTCEVLETTYNWNCDGCECPGDDILGCMDDTACNYNPDATVDDNSCLENDCAGECGGSAEEDECGVCGGDNSSCTDCAGMPNGDAVDLGCGCGESGPSGCDNTCGSTLAEDECGVCGGDNSS
jgi:hypothetical protein